MWWGSFTRSLLNRVKKVVTVLSRYKNKGSRNSECTKCVWKTISLTNPYWYFCWFEWQLSSAVTALMDIQNALCKAPLTHAVKYDWSTVDLLGSKEQHYSCHCEMFIAHLEMRRLTNTQIKNNPIQSEVKEFSPLILKDKSKVTGDFWHDFR